MGTEYGSTNSVIINIFSDALVLHRELLDNIGKRCRTLVQLEVQNCEKAAQCTGALAVEIAKSAGGDGAGRAESARTQFYYLIDQPFRQWLYKLDPDEDVDEAVTLWRAQGQKQSHAKSAAISWSRPDLPLWSENAKITKKEIKTACIITPRPKPSTGFWPISKRFTANKEVKV